MFCAHFFSTSIPGTPRYNFSPVEIYNRNQICSHKKPLICDHEFIRMVVSCADTALSK